MKSNVASFLKLSLGKGTDLSPQVLESLGELGWEPVQGSYDFVYRWETGWDKGGKKMPELSNEIKASVDKALRGSDITYIFKTFTAPEKEQ